MVASGLNTVTIYGPGWTDPHRLQVSGTVHTTAVNQPATLSFLATLDDIYRIGLTDIIGQWIFWTDVTNLPFGGIVDDDPVDIDAGTMAFTCTGVGHALLMDRVTGVLMQPDTGPAGALARRAMTSAQIADPLPFRSVLCDESGPACDVEWRGDPIYDVILDAVNQAGQEFDCPVDSERNIDFILRERIGADKTDSILISEGYSVAGGHIDHSRLTVVNDLTGIAANEDFEKSAYARIENRASIDRFGRRQSVRRYENAVSPLTIKAKVRADIRRDSQAYHYPTITMSARHPHAMNIRHGDTIRLWSRARNRELLFRVMSRTVRDHTTLELAGIGTECCIPPVVPPFTPDLLSGLAGWYDASDASTLTIGDGAVVEWRDKSGHDRTLVNATTTMAYSRTDSRVNLAVVVVPASAYLTQIGTTLDLSETNAITIVAVIRAYDITSTVALQFPAHPVGISVDPDISIQRDGTSHLYAEARGSGGSPSSFQHTALWGGLTFNLVTTSVDLGASSNEVTIYNRSVSAGTRPANGDNAGPFANDTIALYPKHHFAEFIIFDHALTTSHRTAVETYLATKWAGVL